ncbi:MAG: TetR/AcrR family transcriptional regulator, partial [Stenotrophomonas sp.]
VQSLGERDDALFEVLEGMAARIVQSPALSDYWRAVDPDDPSIKAARQTIWALLEAPIQRAIAAGLCRPDLQATDVSLISGMLGAALRGKSREERAKLVARALQLLRGRLQGPVTPEG